MGFQRAHLGHGIGLRSKHYERFLAGAPAVGWIEAISENFIGVGGRPLAVLEKVRRDFPVVLHGVSLSIGSVDPLDRKHLAGLRELADRIQPAYVSDHLCWGTHRGRYLHDLMPLPYTEEALAHVVERVVRVQEALGRQILLENVSSYVAFRSSTMPEWEFLSEVARRADCGILLDVNNIYVSARNHGFDPHAYVDNVIAERVTQIHLAGHTDAGHCLLDTHDHPVADPVWQLYAKVIERVGPTATLLEWDDRIPSFAELHDEALK